MTPMVDAVREVVLRGLSAMVPHQAPARPPRPAARPPALSEVLGADGKMHLGPLTLVGSPTSAMSMLSL